MKPEQLYRLLRETAGKLEITVTEHNFRDARVKVKSGLCRVNGKSRYIMNKHLPIYKKNRLLGACLGGMAFEDVYMAPAVREYIERIKEG